MQIELSDQELKFISEALALVDRTMDSVETVVGVDETERREFKALRLKIDSALLIGAMEEKSK